jgi:hypothetical protein
MSKSSRRRFLAQSVALPVATLLPGPPLRGQEAAPPSARDTTSPFAPDSAATLRALGEVVLPAGELAAGDLEIALQRFARWAEALEPVAELDHPYLSTDEIAYGPPDPRPAWQAQLEALELLASKRHGTSYTVLERAERERLLRDQLTQDLPQALPHPTSAPHVAIALLAWFYSSDEANDLCYRARIGRHQCRGLPSSVERPAPLRGSLFEEASAEEHASGPARGGAS